MPCGQADLKLLNGIWDVDAVGAVMFPKFGFWGRSKLHHDLCLAGQHFHGVLSCLHGTRFEALLENVLWSPATTRSKSCLAGQFDASESNLVWIIMKRAKAKHSFSH